MNPNAAFPITLGVSPNELPSETLRTGPLEFPRGAIAEIVGADSSGRTTVAHSLLAAATANQEICAFVDTYDSFDPASAAACGVVLSQLVWIRCGKNVEHALKAADLLIHAGGFGVVVLDLCQITPRVANSIPLSYWWRFRRAVEKTPAILALLEKQPLAKSSASLMLEMQRKQVVWAGAPGFQVLRESELVAIPRKPVRGSNYSIRAKAWA
jgi:recA bacterial DNA recombination protein